MFFVFRILIERLVSVNHHVLNLLPDFQVFCCYGHSSFLGPGYRPTFRFPGSRLQLDKCRAKAVADVIARPVTAQVQRENAGTGTATPIAATESTSFSIVAGIK